MTDTAPHRPLLFLVEDDVDIANLIRMHLEQAGYAVKVFFEATTVMADAVLFRPSLFVLDIMVPGGGGLDLCRRIRQSPQLASSAIIFLTARTSETDRVLGFELGADDYITKPFSPRELVARVKAVLRRLESLAQSSVLQIGPLEIDSQAMLVRVNAALVSTTATEFRLLEHFARHAGRVFSRDQLLDMVWHDAQYVTVRSIDVYVRRLREKIEADPENPRYIRTVRGVGYRFEAPKSMDCLEVCD